MTTVIGERQLRPVCGAASGTDPRARATAHNGSQNLGCNGGAVAKDGAALAPKGVGDGAVEEARERLELGLPGPAVERVADGLEGGLACAGNHVKKEEK